MRGRGALQRPSHPLLPVRTYGCVHRSSVRTNEPQTLSALVGWGSGGRRVRQVGGRACGLPPGRDSAPVEPPVVQATPGCREAFRPSSIYPSCHLYHRYHLFPYMSLGGAAGVRRTALTGCSGRLGQQSELVRAVPLGEGR